jgi:hypothetical protein
LLPVALFCPLFVVTLAAQAWSADEPKKIIIDTDPGTDDAIALLLAFHSRSEGEAVTIRRRKCHVGHGPR